MRWGQMGSAGTLTPEPPVTIEHIEEHVRFVEDPPPWVEFQPRDRHYLKWSRYSDQLKTRPGVWAQLQRGDKRKPLDLAAERIRGGKGKHWLPVGSFESTVRRDREFGDFVLWARYLGES